METDGPLSSSSSSSSSSSGGLFSGVRTLKTIIKKKTLAGVKIGGSGIAKGAPRVSVHPKKQKLSKEALLSGGLSPKSVQSRYKNIVRRANKRLRKP